MRQRHGLRRHPQYPTWKNMMHRCYNAKNPFFKDYGGRGIKVCAGWQLTATFIAWCETQTILPGQSLDRFPDNDGDYTPGNCRFASPAEQNRNMRTNLVVERDGERLIFKDFVKKYGVVGYPTALYRVSALGMSLIDAATIPTKGRGGWWKERLPL